jgi:uncharacterized protein (TIGR03435 family)
MKSPVQRGCRKACSSIVVAMILALTSNLSAQAAARARSGIESPETSKPPQFEVATIKPVNPNASHSMGVNVYQGGRVVITGFTLKNLTCTAFHLGYWQVSGGESWMEKTTYDVEAKAPASVQTDQFSVRHSLFDIEDSRLRQMLQSLLSDRFQLKFHRETKSGLIYLLEKNGKPLRLHPREAAEHPQVPVSTYPFGEVSFMGRNHWFINNVSTSQLAKFASDFVLHHPVLDRTGLSGTFDYDTPKAQIDSDIQNEDWANSLTSSFLVLIPELGLKLTSAKGPVETYVIDSAERPSQN